MRMFRCLACSTVLARTARTIGVVVGGVGVDASGDDENDHENDNGNDNDIDGEWGYDGPEYDDAKRHGSAVQCSEL